MDGVVVNRLYAKGEFNMKRVSQNVLIGALMFVIGGLVFGSRTVVIGQAPCATDTPTLASTAAATLSFAPDNTGSRKTPVPFGKLIDEQWTLDSGAKENFNLAITRIINGSDALAQIKQDSGFMYQPPADGLTYMAVYIEGQYRDGPDTPAGMLNAVQVRALSDGQFTDATIATKSPTLNFTGFPGAKIKGWAVVNVFTDDPAPLIVIGANTLDGTHGVYFATK